MSYKVDVLLSDTFGLPAPEQKQLPKMLEHNQPEEISEIDDFEFVREKLHSLLTAGADAFEDLAVIAREEEKISAFGTMNTMLNTLSDISMRLIEIQKMKVQIEKEKKAIGGEEPPPQQNNKVVNNNTVFVGSMAELAAVARKNNGDIIDV